MSASFSDLTASLEKVKLTVTEAHDIAAALASSFASAVASDRADATPSSVLAEAREHVDTINSASDALVSLLKQAAHDDIRVVVTKSSYVVVAGEQRRRYLGLTAEEHAADEQAATAGDDEQEEEEDDNIYKGYKKLSEFAELIEHRPGVSPAELVAAVTRLVRKCGDAPAAVARYHETIGTALQSPPELQWNHAYQSALDSPPEGRAKLLASLATDFVATVEHYSRVIVAEQSLPPALRTIQPTSKLGGLAGGTKFIVNGVLFKIPTDPVVSGGHGKQHLYSGSKKPSWELAAKTAGHDAKGANAFTSASSELSDSGVRVPLQVAVDVMGFRVLAMPLLPLGEDSLKYGSSDGGATVHADDEAINAAMREIGKALHLAPHFVGSGDQRKELAFAGDVECHLGSDGRLYGLDFGRLLPPEASDVVQHLGKGEGFVELYRLLRLELLQKLKERGSPPLCGDGYTGWIRAEEPGRRRKFHSDLRDATRFMLGECVPGFAEELVRSVNRGNEGEWLHKLSQRAHEHGINVRHLGLVRLHVVRGEENANSAAAADVLLVEAVKRAAKNVLREVLRDLPLANSTTANPLLLVDDGDSSDEEDEVFHHSSASSRQSMLLSSAVGFVRLLCGHRAESATFWSEHMRWGIEQRFGAVALAKVDVSSLHTHPAIARHLLHIVEYCLECVGMKLSPSFVADLRALSDGDLASALCAATVGPLDVQLGRPRVKGMDVLAQAEGEMLLEEAAAQVEQALDSGDEAKEDDEDEDEEDETAVLHSGGSIEATARLVSQALDRLGSATGGRLGESDKQQFAKVARHLARDPTRQAVVLEWLQHHALSQSAECVLEVLGFVLGLWETAKHDADAELSVRALGGASSRDLVALAVRAWAVLAGALPPKRTPRPLKSLLVAHLAALDGLRDAVERHSPAAARAVLVASGAELTALNEFLSHAEISASEWSKQHLLHPSEAQLALMEALGGGSLTVAILELASSAEEHALWHAVLSPADTQLLSRGLRNAAEQRDMVKVLSWLRLGAPLAVLSVEERQVADVLLGEGSLETLHASVWNEWSFGSGGVVEILVERVRALPTLGKLPIDESQLGKKYALALALGEEAIAQQVLGKPPAGFLEGMFAKTAWLPPASGELDLSKRDLTSADVQHVAYGVAVGSVVEVDFGDAVVDYAAALAVAAALRRNAALRRVRVNTFGRLCVCLVAHVDGERLGAVLGGDVSAHDLASLHVALEHDEELAKCIRQRTGLVQSLNLDPLSQACAFLRENEADEQRRLVQRMPELDSGALSGSAARRRFVAAMEQNTTVEALELGGCKLGQSAVDAVAGWLATNASARVLDLRDNKVEDVAALAAALRTNTSLERVILGGNRVREWGPMEEVLRGGRRVGGDVVECVWTAKYAEYEFSSEEVKRAVLDVLDEGSTTTELDLHGSGVTDGDVVAIGEALRVSNLLTELDLRGNQIADLAPLGEALRANSTLTQLDLRGNQIANVSPLGEALRENSTLTGLWLNSNQITDVAPLAEALRENQTLTTLYLQGNQISDVAPLGEALRTNTSLERVMLGGNRVRDWAPLGEVLEGGRRVAGDMMLTAKYAGYEFSSERVKRAVLDLLDEGSTATRLNLNDSGVTDGDVVAIGDALRESSTLTALWLTRNQIVDVAALGEALRENSTLTALWLAGNQIVDVAALGEALRENSTLTHLHLSGNQIADVAALGEALRVSSTLTHLDLNSNQIVDVAALGEALRENQTLTVLDLGDNQIADVASLGEALRENQTLTQLHLSGNQIADVAALGEALRENSTLTQLHLSGNQIVDVAALGEALRVNQTLTKLDLGGNQIVDVAPLGEALRENSTLTVLYLRWNQIADVAPLGDALRVNQTLTKLYLGSNQISDVAPLGEALRVNQTLTELWLRDNQIADVTPLVEAPLVEALRENSTLELNLQFNPISSEGRAAIRAAGGARDWLSFSNRPRD